MMGDSDAKQDAEQPKPLGRTAESPRLLVVIDPTPSQYAEFPAVRVELLADVEVACHETGQRIKLARGRYVVVEASILQTPPSAEGVWS